MNRRYYAFVAIDGRIVEKRLLESKDINPFRWQFNLCWESDWDGDNPWVTKSWGFLEIGLLREDCEAHYLSLMEALRKTEGGK